MSARRESRWRREMRAKHGDAFVAAIDTRAAAAKPWSEARKARVRQLLSLSRTDRSA